MGRHAHLDAAHLVVSDPVPVSALAKWSAAGAQFVPLTST
jgi:hypothetical protein